MTTIPRFWREIPQRYNLKGIKCANCQTITFPAKSICPNCRHESVGKLEPYQLSGKGQIESWTTIHTAPAGFEDQAPYIMGIIKLDEGPKVTAQIVDTSPEKLDVGAPVKAVFRRINEEGEAGVIHYGYKFKLAS